MTNVKISRISNLKMLHKKTLVTKNKTKAVNANSVFVFGK